MVGELLESANNIKKLIGLNDYVDKVKIGPRRNFILARDLELSQIFNWVSIEDFFLKVELILIPFFLTLLLSIMLPNFLYLIFLISSASNSTTESLLDSPKLVPALLTLAQIFKSWKLLKKIFHFSAKTFNQNLQANIIFFSQFHLTIAQKQSYSYYTAKMVFVWHFTAVFPGQYSIETS